MKKKHCASTYWDNARRWLGKSILNETDILYFWFHSNEIINYDQSHNEYFLHI